MSDVVSGVPTQRSEHPDSARPQADATGETPAVPVPATAPAPGVGAATGEPARAATGEPARAATDVAGRSPAGSPTGTVAKREPAQAAGAAVGDDPTPLGRAQDTVQRAGEVAGEVADKVGDAVERAAQASGRVAVAVVERLRNNAEVAAERGTTTIADEVVEKIAGIAAREVPGVYDLGGDVARALAAVKERIGLGDADEGTDRGVRVRLEGCRAVVNVTLVIEYGFVVHSVTEKVRAKVINAVENMLGLEVVEVNILVDDVHVEDEADAPA
jgi:uncharacterized alkaline shock family protein YloU